jgi:serine beta-lactamase-like protein LACTB, mitochondrial
VAKVATLESAVDAAMRRHGIPGLTVAVVLNKELAWSAGFGMSDLENFVPAKTVTLYRLASVTKPITATAVLQLAEKGRVDLDAPIQRYVPGFPEKPWPVTSRQLLCHQGGVRNWTPEEFRNTRRFASVADSLIAFKDDPLAFEPGTQTLYSSFGYTLLGAVVEAASGMSYMEYLRTAVFDPAGMEWARADEVLAIVPNRAAGYQPGSGGEIMNSALSDVSNRLPGGGLMATADDVALFATALLQGTLLQRETLDAALTRQKTKDGRLSGYGLGWVVGRTRGSREAYHLGGQQKVSTVLYLLPDAGAAVAVLSNLEGRGNEVLELARQLGFLATRPGPR